MSNFKYSLATLATYINKSLANQIETYPYFHFTLNKIYWNLVLFILLGTINVFLIVKSSIENTLGISIEYKIK